MGAMIKKWLPWVIAFAAGAWAWFQQFIAENPLPADETEEVVQAVMRTLGLG